MNLMWCSSREYDPLWKPTCTQYLHKYNTKSECCVYMEKIYLNATQFYKQNHQRLHDVSVFLFGIIIHINIFSLSCLRRKKGFSDITIILRSVEQITFCLRIVNKLTAKVIEIFYFKLQLPRLGINLGGCARLVTKIKI